MTASPAQAMDRSAGTRARWVPLAAIAFSVLVIYGSLVPLDFRPVPWDAALERFANIRYLRISAQGRADWVANILLFIPLAFFWSAVVSGGKPSRGFRVCAVFVFCVVFAVALEFCQIWFAPRTVSINDIIAEWIGSAIGVLTWLFCGPALLRTGAVVSAGGTPGLMAGLGLYAGAYLIYILMPFDFVVSAAEFGFMVGNHGIIPLVSPQCGDIVRCGAKSAIEIVSFVPLGFLLVLIAANYNLRPPRPATGFLLGAFAGLLIEVAQIFIVSAVSQWLSVATRAVGMMAGIYLGRRWNPAVLPRLVAILPAMLWLTGAAYVLIVGVLIWHGGWKTEGGLARLSSINWLPFYYHYWTTEQAALVSVIFNAMLYAPIGAMFWLTRFWESGGFRTHLRGAGRASAAAVLLAVVVEASRLFKAPAHPDPTNLLIAAIAAGLAFKTLGWGAGCLLSNVPHVQTRHRPFYDPTR